MPAIGRRADLSPDAAPVPAIANLGLWMGQTGAVGAGTAGRLRSLGCGDSEIVAVNPAMLGCPRQ